MALTATDLAWVRDEVGTATPPTDADLNASFDVVLSRTLVALRVLKRRRAAAAGGAEVTSFTLSGVLSVGKKTDLKALDSQIARLEALWAAEQAGLDVNGVAASTTHLRRATAR